ncbi:hypothetical protein CTI12_AA385820 [Artemisia annua]|uniref:Uncharacterized protein n=1 Tax=Artemisia annua TaxID=35608 RepID=A0A2U1MBH6_ARTAN|nr:hypothetical protein CTI12_AA385820 [Artemisia annua]
MEKALIKVGSIKAGSFWVSKKAKEEITNISQDLSVMDKEVECYTTHLIEGDGTFNGVGLDSFIKKVKLIFRVHLLINGSI